MAHFSFWYGFNLFFFLFFFVNETKFAVVKHQANGGLVL